ncbi:phosphate regulon sensor protein PhoR, partial [mine drainage metagenome]
MARDISTLARLEQMRRDFVANVSHELRTPLTVIHGYLELLDPEDVPQLAGVLNDMRGQSKRMAQIVEDLLTLSRLETQTGANEEPVAMAPLLATLRREAEALSQGRHRITLEVETPADLYGSLKDLHSACSNLVSNAVRYTPSGGSIRIRWERLADGRGAFSVIDTGYGIPRTTSAASPSASTAYPQPLARQRRYRAGTVHRQARAGHAPGAHRDPQRAGPRLDLHRAVPGRAHAAAGRRSRYGARGLRQHRRRLAA